MSNDKIIVDNIAKALSLIKPEKKSQFIQNAKNYKRELDRLDKEYKKELSNCSINFFVVSHAAFGYIADSYGLKQVPIYGLSAESEPSAKQIKDIIDLSKNKSIKAIYFEKMVNPKVSEVIAKEIGAKTYVLDPGATLKKGENFSFIEIMRNNLKNLKNGLGCR
jgi:zinc transport system substrate-binding protein